MATITQRIALLFKRKRRLPTWAQMTFITVINGLVRIKSENFLLFATMGTVTRQAMPTSQGIIFMCLDNNVYFVAIKADTILRFFEQIGKIGYMWKVTGLTVLGRPVDKFLLKFF